MQQQRSKQSCTRTAERATSEDGSPIKRRIRPVLPEQKPMRASQRDKKAESKPINMDQNHWLSAVSLQQFLILRPKSSNSRTRRWFLYYQLRHRHLFSFCTDYTSASSRSLQTLSTALNSRLAGVSLQQSISRKYCNAIHSSFDYSFINY